MLLRLPARFKPIRWLAAAALLGLGVLWGLDRLYPPALPAHAETFARVVTDRHGEPLRAFPDAAGIWRYPTTIEQVSPRYLEALLNYEDRWFRRHPGINPLSLMRAAVQNLRGGRIISGGSTLTMQVARLLHPHGRDIPGKLYQMLRALQLEWRLDKDQILGLYLNLAPFGGTLEGVQAAAHSYLGKSALDLTHAEAALLAVLPQAPTRLRPDLHPAAAQRARDKVLRRLVKFGVWGRERAADAQLETVYAHAPDPPLKAPLLARRLVSERPAALIRTTLDGPLQAALEDWLRGRIREFPAGVSAAVLVVENADAAVRAYLGSADFLDSARFGHVDMITAGRSPGSTLKPFLYGMALDAGLIHSHSLLADAPRRRSDYRPGNFSAGFNGPVSAAAALQRSLNVPAVNLLERFGPGRFHSRLAGSGLTLAIPGDGEPNLANILGGAGTSLEQLTRAYLAFSHQGQSQPLRLIREQPVAPGRFLLSPGAAWIVRRLLADIPGPHEIRRSAAARAPGLAWKSGTSYGFRDAWAIGVGARYTIGVWAGRPDGAPVQGQHGRATAAPLLFAVADYLGEDRPALPRPPPSVTQGPICWPLGIAEGAQDAAQCHRRHLAWILDQQIPPTWIEAADAQWRDLSPAIQVAADSGLRLTPNCDGGPAQPRTLALWPQELEPWLPAGLRRAGQIPDLDPRCTGDDAAALAAPPQIIGIRSGSVYAAIGDEPPSIHLQAAGGSGRLHWYIDGAHRYSLEPGASAPHPLEQPGAVRISVVDDAGRLDQVEIRVESPAAAPDPGGGL